MKVVLTIGGSDPAAGAGIQADLKTFAALGVYGTSAVTAVTIQNTSGIADTVAISADTVRLQIDELWRDLPADAVKIGMLANRGVAAAVADALARHGPPRLVIDPVMKATQPGVRTLLEPDAVSILTSALFPLATVVTPNAEEAAVLSGIPVQSLNSARDAARRIADFGPMAVVVKGGHLGERQHAVDVLFYAGTLIELTGPRFASAPHGTGCTFASAIAARLALGDDVPAAVKQAKAYVSGAIEHALALGRGAPLLDHFWQARAGRGLYS